MKLCVIPARGGSKRIPRKNIREFCGEPMISYSIRAAIDSGCFDHVIVSTDDADIAAVAKTFNAEVPFTRPGELADDHTSTSAVTAHATQWYLDQGYPVEYTCCIYATAPFLQPTDILSAFEMLHEHSDFAYCFSVAEYNTPIQRALRRNSNGEASMFEPDNYYKRSQDLEPSFHDAGQFYWGRTAAVLAEAPVFLSKALAFVLPRTRVEDIDTPEDWHRAEIMYRVLNGLVEEEPNQTKPRKKV
jgi:pseudaminic acid cytidylyltransferase